MAYLKTLIILFFFMYGHITASFFGLFKKNSTKKDDELNSRTIFFETKLESIDTLLKNNKEINTKEQLLLTFPKVKYTAMQCKYAEIVSDVFQLFSEHILHFVKIQKEVKSSDITPKLLKRTRKWLYKIVGHFISIKSDIVKIIYELFKKLDENTILKTSDPSFLKSLLSIYLFLHHKINEKSLISLKKMDKKYVIDFMPTLDAVNALRKPIIHIINLVNHFRSKNCFVFDPFNCMMGIKKQLKDLKVNSKVRTIIDLLEPNLKKLLSSIGIKTKGSWRSSFNTNMYNPDNLILSSLLDDINNMDAHITVKWYQHDYDINVAFSRAQNSCDIVKILECQNILFKVIANLFYRKINFLLKKGIHEIDDLLVSFDEVVSKIIPNNCSSDVFLQMIIIRDSLKSILKSSQKQEKQKNVSLLEKQLEYLIQNNSDVTIVEIENSSFMDELCVKTLVKSMQTKAEFKIFSQVFKLLSFESNTNDDYSIDYEDGFKNESTMELTTTLLKDLRYNLFLFRMLLADYGSIESLPVSASTSSNKSKKKPSSPATEKKPSTHNDDMLNDDKLSESIGHMSSYIINLYGRFVSCPEVSKMLLPVLIHLRYTLSFAHGISRSDLVTLYNISFIIINTIERFEIKTISEPIYSSDIYTSVQEEFKLLSGKPNVPEIRNKLKKIAENFGLVNAKSTIDTLNGIYDKHVCDKFLTNDRKELQFYWNGRKKFGSDILLELKQGVIDTNDLINYQWYTIKYFVTKFLVKMKFILLHYRNKKQFDHRDTSNENCIKSTIQEFRTSKFPSSVFTFVDFTCTTFMVALDLQRFGKAEWLIDKRLEELCDENSKDYSLPAETMDIVCDTLITDIHDLKKVLRVININRPTSLITEEMHLSNVLPPL